MAKEVTPEGYVNVGNSNSGNPNKITVDVGRGDNTTLVFVDELPSSVPSLSSAPSSAPTASPSLSVPPLLLPSAVPSLSAAPSD